MQPELLLQGQYLYFFGWNRMLGKWYLVPFEEETEMKSFAIACAALIFAAATASAGELAVSKSTLSSMGLGGMQTMSDSDGTAVRGKGVFANVWGGSIASFPGQSANNNYSAGASWLGPVGATAAGNSFSFAGGIHVQFLADPTGFSLSVNAAAGFSGGFANASAN